MEIGNRYRVIKKISETNNNIIYKVSDKKTGKTVALKLLKTSEPNFIARFKKEFFILQTLIHPNIVKVFDLASIKDKKKEFLYFTMEFVDGAPINLYFKKYGYTKFLPVFLEILRTMKFIHNKGFLHCDLKPHHLLLDKTGKVKLVDFGFALFEKSDIGKEIGGTLRYMAPEILRGEKPDIRTEIYSLGIIMYECLTGRKVFGGKRTKHIIEAVLHKSLSPIRKKKDIPDFVNEIIMGMTDKLRKNRYSNIDALIEVIENRGRTLKKEKTIDKVLYSDFIGRKKYLGIALNLLKKSSTGNGQILLIEGITGIGKTRLLKELEYRLFLEGKDTQSTRITDKEKQDFEWLIQLLRRAGSKLTHLREVFKKGEVNLSGNKKYLFYEKIEKELSEISQKKMQVFVIDDMDFRKKMLGDFIIYISNFIAENPFFIILATEKIPENLIKTIEKGNYENISRLTLKGLSREEILLFTKNMLGVNENVESLTDFLYVKTEGNPYFIEELLKEIVERKLLKKSGKNLIYNISKLKNISVPKNVEVFVQKRLKKLSDEEKEILKIVSVFGGSVPILWLTNLSPFNEPETIKICENLYLSQFFTISYDEKYDFTHKILKEIIYTEIKDKERITLHKKFLKFLENLKETPSILQLKANHSYAAGLRKAKSFLQKILRKALKSQDVETAIDAFQKLKTILGRNLLKEIDSDSILKTGNHYTLLGYYKEAIKLYSKLLSIVKNKKERIKILHNLAFIKTITGKYNEAEKILEDLLKAIKEKDIRFELLIDRGWLYFSKSDFTMAGKIYKEALILSTKLKRKSLLPKLLYNLGILKERTEEYKEAEEYGKKALTIARASKNQIHIIAALNLLGRIEQQRGRYNKAILYYEDAVKYLNKSKNLLRMLNILVNLSENFYFSGEIASCEENYFNAINLAKKLGRLYEIAYLFNRYGSILSRKGKWRTAEEFFKKSLEIGVSIKNFGVQFDNLTELALLSAFQGNKNRFEDAIKKAIRLKKEIKDEKEILKIDLVRGIEKYISEDFERAIFYLERIIKTIEKTNAPEHQIPALIYKGLSLVKMDRKNEALDALKKAKEMMRKSGIHLYKEEAELAGIEIIKDKITTKLKKRIEKLINNTNIKAQPFLYARCLILLSDIKLRTFNRKKEINSLTESINYLKKAKEILEKMDAEPFIPKLNTKFLKLIDEFIHLEVEGPKKKSYLELLKELGKTIKNINNPEELKERFLSMAKKLTGAERGLFLTLNPDTDNFIITGKDMDKATITDAKKFSRSVINRVKRTKRPLISYDAVQDRRFKKSESVLINNIHSVLCIPVINEDRVLGTLYLDSRKKPGLFSKEDKDFFGSLSNLLAGTLMKALEFRKIEEETILLKKHLRTRFGPKNIIGKSGKMQEVFDKIEKAAKIDIPVLMLGDTGTGKELVAATIHQLSKRKANIFSIVDCLALTLSLLESELFGYTKGAFTGADRQKIGLLEASKDGTIFIDEIGDASYAIQSNLLRFLDTGEVKKIGATKYHKVDTRIIAATNKDIYQLVAEGKFRKDLFYRINKFVIQLPPLRERKEDIKLLLEYFLALFNRKYNKEIKGLTKDAFELLFNYDWPGNVREFESEIERCVLFCNKSLITKEFLSPCISRLPPHFFPLKEMEKISRLKHIQNVLDFTGNNVAKAAEILETHRRTIYRILKKVKKT